jgi:hypothetical protein
MTDFEEFEFKPLTEGLGFHKKAEKIKTDIKSTQLGRETTSRAIPEVPPRSVLFGDDDAVSASQPAPRSATQSISELMASLPPSLDFLDDKQDLTRSGLSSRPAPVTTSASLAASMSPASAGMSAAPIVPSSQEDRPQIYQPLGRKEERAGATAPASSITGVLPAPGTRAGMSATSASATIPAPMSPSPYREKLNESYARAFPHSPKSKTQEPEIATNAEGLIPVSANFAAGFIDAMVVAGIATVFLVCILTITKINLIGLLTNARTDSATHMHLAMLTLAVLQMYMLVSRAFFGSTLGEWAFEMQLGTEAQQRKPYYPLQVIGRTLVTTLTGLVVLPLLSFGLRRDIAKYFTGVQLYRRP